MKQKFKIGDKVREKDSGNKEVSKVLSFSFNGEEYLYKLSSTEVDVENKELVEGVKFCKQDELEVGGEDE